LASPVPAPPVTRLLDPLACASCGKPGHQGDDELEDESRDRYADQNSDRDNQPAPTSHLLAFIPDKRDDAAETRLIQALADFVRSMASSDRPTAAPQALLSIADAARYLNVSVSTMRSLALGRSGVCAPRPPKARPQRPP
jgi:hypothetical protein